MPEACWQLKAAFGQQDKSLGGKNRLGNGKCKARGRKNRFEGVLKKKHLNHFPKGSSFLFKNQSLSSGTIL